MTLTIDQLTVTYRDGDHALLALDRVDLSLEPARITVLVGESGSGKTTLGKALMGLLPDNAAITGCLELGEKEIVGMDEAGLNEIRWSRVAMVFQNGASNLNPVHRIIDQVAEPLIQHGCTDEAEARRRAQEGLQRMGLRKEHGLRFPHELSGGEIQRALLAMALVMGPEILILDEPTSALDAMTKAFVAHVIGEVRAQGASVLLITHDIGVARKIADRIGVMLAGTMVEIGPAVRVLGRPLHPYTSLLIRSAEEGAEVPPWESKVPHETGCPFAPRCRHAGPQCISQSPPQTNPYGGYQEVRCFRPQMSINSASNKD